MSMEVPMLHPGLFTLLLSPKETPFDPDMEICWIVLFSDEVSGLFVVDH